MIRKILIDIGHPAHVHYFKILTRILTERGYKILFTAREKEMSLYLLDYYKFDYINFGKPYTSRIGKIFGLFLFSFKLFKAAQKFKPDLFLNATFYSALVAKILKKPHFSIEDTFNKESLKTFMPFTDVVITGDYSHPHLGRKQIQISAYQELFYLHPEYFKPDKEIRKQLNLGENEKYVILRFISWNASHDYGHHGMTYINKLKAVERFSRYAKVFISSEGPLTPELQEYKFPLPAEKMHDAMASADLIFGESATMVSEGAILGVPGVYIDSTGRFYTRDQESKYGLVFNFTETPQQQEEAIKTAEKLLSSSESGSIFQRKKDKMLKEKINPVTLLLWLIDEYPDSLVKIRQNPGIQYNFR